MLNRLLDWHEEVSRIRIHTVDVYDFTLHAYGTGFPLEVLTISAEGLPGARLDIGVDQTSLTRLGDWLVRSWYLLNRLRKKRARINDARNKRRREHVHATTSSEKTVSRLRISDSPDEYHFKLVAGEHETVLQPPDSLEISAHGTFEKELQIGVDQARIQQLADWVLDCTHLLRWLRARKEAETTDALRTIRLTHIHSYSRVFD
jgi:hypothetical protein